MKCPDCGKTLEPIHNPKGKPFYFFCENRDCIFYVSRIAGRGFEIIFHQIDKNPKGKPDFCKCESPSQSVLSMSPLRLKIECSHCGKPVTNESIQNAIALGKKEKEAQNK